MIISNQCILSEGWTIDNFMEKHESQPYNPDIADVFYRAGYIEHWGRRKSVMPVESLEWICLSMSFEDMVSGFTLRHCKVRLLMSKKRQNAKLMFQMAFWRFGG